jgi:hypothetical protein
MSDNEALVTARSLYKDNKKQEARTLLANAIIAEPDNPDLWFGLAFCLEDQDQIIYSLKRVLQINPDHPKAAAELRKRENPAPVTEETQPLPAPPEQPVPPVVVAADTRPVKPAPSKPVPPAVKTVDQTATQKDDDYFLNVVVKGVAGGSAAAIGEKWRYRGLYIGLFIVFLLIIDGSLMLWNPSVRAYPILATPLFVFALIALFFGPKLWDPAFNKSALFRQGARAEVRVGETLQSLGPNFVIINDIQTGRGNIDHLVLSKTGQVFVIETKSHFGRLEITKDDLFINSHHTEKDFIKQVQGNAIWARDRIQSLGITPVWATPILVFTNLFVPRTPPVKGVYVENIKYLNTRIQGVARTTKKNAVWENRAKIIRAMGK